MSSCFKCSDKGFVEPTVDWASLPLLVPSLPRRKRGSALIYFTAGLVAATLIGAIF